MASVLKMKEWIIILCKNFVHSRFKLHFTLQVTSDENFESFQNQVHMLMWSNACMQGSASGTRSSRGCCFDDLYLLFCTSIYWHGTGKKQSDVNVHVSKGEG